MTRDRDKEPPGDSREDAGPIGPSEGSHAETDPDDLRRLSTLRMSQSDKTSSKVNSPYELFSLQRGAVIGQYELIRELGRGGMGAVFLARDVRLGRRVAVKFLAHDSQAWRAERFRAEARVTARCRHENIVVIHDIGEVPGYSYMVLEYLKGITLRAWLGQRWQSKGRIAGQSTASLMENAASHSWSGATHDLPYNDATWSMDGAVTPELTSARAAVRLPTSAPVSMSLAVELMVPVVRALAHAHALGLVHRDLKPENIMLLDEGPIKVLDFGIAKLLDRPAISPAFNRDSVKLRPEPGFNTDPTALVGTLPYMSPEQWGIADVDERSDIWAVGIMLWELLTGRHPLEPISAERLETVAQLELPMPSMLDMRPEVGPLGILIDRCLRKRKAERIASTRELLAQLEALSPGGGGRASSESGESGDSANPFAGLAAFQEADAGRFFGRDRDVSSMMAQLRNHSMVTVIGPSGAGKSSFVRAGVIPSLKRSGQSTEAFILRPGRQPLAALANVLAHIVRRAGDDSGLLDANAQAARIDTLRTQPGYLGATLRARCRKLKTHIALFIDQFEELYTLGTDRESRRAFVGCLEGAADDASSPLRVLISLRSDFLDRVAEDRAFTSEIMRGLMLLPPMGREELRQALTRPLEATGHAFETDDMVDTMLDTLETTRCPLPLLQFTATKLWDARDRERKLFTRDSYTRLGGVAGALAAHADAVLTGLSIPEQRLARAVFTSLVTDQRTRAIVSVAELRATAPDGAGDAIEQVVNHLASERLVLIETDSERGSTVELSHESLIDRWPKLGQWLDENLDDAQFRTRLRAAAREWHQQGRTADLLWRGQAAEDAGRWFERWQARGDTRPAGAGPTPIVDLSMRDRDYLQAVVDLAARARRRRRQFVVATVAFLSAIAVVVSLLALRANRAAMRADQQAAEAARQAAEAAQQARRATSESIQARNAGRMLAAREQQSDPTLVLALVRELEPPHLPRRWAELARWALQRGVAQVVLTHEHQVYSAAFSPDGTRIVTTSFDKNARVYNADGAGRPVVLRGHQHFVTSAAFSPDGTRVVTTSYDKTARLHNADGSGQPVVLRGHQHATFAAAFSPDSTRIVITSSRDKIAWVHRADGSGQPVVLRGHLNLVESAAFSPDSTHIVTASRDGTARVYRADGSGQPVVLRGHRDFVHSASFSPDGTHIVTASRDRTARVYRADGSGRPVVLRGHQDDVHSALFSPDGTRIVTASRDRTARVYRADGSGQPVVLCGHQDDVYSALFSPDGTRIVTASRDMTARVYSADGGEPVVLRGHQDAVESAEFSPDGTRIVTASRDKTARVYSSDGTGRLAILRGHLERVYSAAFSPDGMRIVTASRDNTARVYRADGSGRPVVLRGHQDFVHWAAFSPDGTRIVTASRDGTARVYRADGSGQPVVLRGHRDDVHWAAFSRDGKRIVTASADRTARVYRADGRGQPVVLRGHRARVISAAFSRDGSRIVTASFDKTARVYNADGSGQPLVFDGHTEPLSKAVFSSDGNRIITISYDRTMRISKLDGSGQFEIVRIPDIDAWSAALSPDGTRIVSASHPEQIVSPGAATRTEHTASVWSDIEPLTDLNDPKLWTATNYCPSVDQRVDLLGVPRDKAREHRERCLQRVDEARKKGSPGAH